MSADRVRIAGPDPLDLLASEADAAAQAGAGSAGPGGPGAPGGSDAGPDAAAVTNAQAVAGAIAAGREAFCFFTKLESPRRILDDDRAGQLAALADPVLTKHGIELGRYLGDYGPEIALSIGLFAVVAELRAAVALEIAAKASKAKDKAPDPNTVDAAPAADLDAAPDGPTA